MSRTATFDCLPARRQACNMKIDIRYASVFFPEFILIILQNAECPMVVIWTRKTDIARVVGPHNQCRNTPGFVVQETDVAKVIGPNNHSSRIPGFVFAHCIWVLIIMFFFL